METYKTAVLIDKKAILSYAEKKKRNLPKKQKFIKMEDGVYELDGVKSKRFGRWVFWIWIRPVA